MRDQSDFIY